MNLKTMRRLLAMLAAIMMLVPMAAQAEATAPTYNEVSVSDLVVNYAGTEYDFTGLGLKLLCGVDTANKNAIGGVTLSVPDEANNATLAVELGEKEMDMLLLNQLVKIPYDKFGETFSKLSGQDAAQMGDISSYVEQFWSQASNIGSDNTLEAASTELNKYLQDTYFSKFTDLGKDLTPEDAEFTIDGTDYKGQKTVLKLTSEQANEMMQAAAAMYTDEKVMAVLKPIISALDSQATSTTNSTTPISDMYTKIIESLGKITIPDGMTVTTYTAKDADGNDVQNIVIDKFTLDMTEYINAINEMSASTADSSEATAELTKMAYGMNIFEIGKADENGVINNPSHLDISYDIYKADDEDSFANVSVVTNDMGSGAGNLNFTINVDPAKLDSTETSGAVNIALNSDWSGDDTGKKLSGAVTVSTGDTQQAAVNLDFASTDSATGSQGKLTLTVTQGTEDATPVLTLDYTSAPDATATANKQDVEFKADVMGLVSVSGKASFSSEPMTADKLMSTNATDVLDLSTATEDDLTAFTTSLQTALQNTLLSAMKVPGVASIMAASQSSTSTDTTASDATAADAPEATTAPVVAG